MEQFSPGDLKTTRARSVYTASSRGVTSALLEGVLGWHPQILAAGYSVTLGVPQDPAAQAEAIKQRPNSCHLYSLSLSLPIPLGGFFPC